jgi:hypothetical protein
MIAQGDLKVERKLRTLEMIRVIVGVAGIAAVFAVIVCGVVAFMKDSDAWLAMRLPLAIALLLIAAFARSAKAIVALAAIRRP